MTGDEDFVNLLKQASPERILVHIFACEREGTVSTTWRDRVHFHGSMCLHMRTYLVAARPSLVRNSKDAAQKTSSKA
ncbi:hypothetical protein AAFF_G00141070 [Aldrovandia affinis]|uniref:Uncharacterized protein n=1 Tax=Aldrovandia affinis TaxID=143900 RepID=A0AAD7TDS3_9TELE|nr:hypothetical protein AAFF_G00141070 [Aldrovandia affinis]